MSWIVETLQGETAAKWIGGAAGALIVAVVKALGPALQRAATRLWQRKAEELERMDEREKEGRAAAEEAASDPLMAALRALTELREENARLRADVDGLCADVAKLAAAKNVAEGRAEAAVAEAAALRHEMQAGHHGLPPRNHAEDDPDARGARGAPGPDGDRVDGGRPTARPVRAPRRPQGR